MKRTLIPFLLMSAIPGAAHAANLNGTYSIVLSQLCQSIDNELFKPSTRINTIDTGKLSQSIGFVVLTPSKPGALTGTIAVHFTQSQGSAAIMGLPGPPAQPDTPDMTIQNVSQNGSYAITLGAGLSPSSLKLSFAGQKQMAYTAYFSQLSGGIYKHGTFMNLGGDSGGKPTCTNQGTIDLM